MSGTGHQSYSIFRIFGRSSLVIAVAAGVLHAEVKYDGSMGTSGNPGTVLSGGRTTFQIRDTEGQTRGTNLFHSFEKFDLTSAESATFLGPAGIKNILARVTNGASSSIDGMILSQITGANLILMNPKGIVFGPNASVDVSGSFFATTADYIKLGTDGRFAATQNAAHSVLTVSDPSAFGFLTPSSAAIRVKGSTLTGAKTLGLIGGDVIVEGGSTLMAEDVQLIATRSAGEASLRLPDSHGVPHYAEINADGFTTHGSVSVGEATNLAAPPPSAAILANRIVIRGGTLAVKNTTAVATAARPGEGMKIKASGHLTVQDSLILSDNVGDVRGQPAIDISARSASISGSTTIFSFTRDTGAGGELRMNIDGTLSLTEGAGVGTDSISEVVGGDIRITAGELMMDNSHVVAGANIPNTKNGDIFLNVAGSMSLTNGASVELNALGAIDERIVVNAADLTISGVGSMISFRDQSLGGIGAGGIEVHASGKLSILNGGQIAADTSYRSGADISISARDVFISGTGAALGHTGISSVTLSDSEGPGGNIRLDVTNLLEVLDGGAIASNTLGQGDGGNISIRAHDMVVTGPSGAAIKDYFNPYGITAQNIPLARGSVSGKSGNVTLTLSGRLDVRDNGLIAVDTTGTGRGGNIDILADSMAVSSGGIVTARTTLVKNGGSGGNISVKTSKALEVTAGGQITVATLGSGAGGSLSIRGGEIRLRGQDAMLSAISGSPTAAATGAGGDILVEADLVDIADGARINAGTLGSGNGGNIVLSTNTMRISSSAAPTGLIAQTAGLSGGGAGGTIMIDADAIKLVGRGATITTQSFGSGNGGRIEISTDTLDLQRGSSIQSAATGAGNAGAITITADGNMTLTGGSSISVDSALSNAGDINLRSSASILLTNSQITAQAALNGGNIDLRTKDLLRLTNSQITAAAGINGGNIFIDPIFVLFDRSLVSANAVRGRGGNIRIISDFFFASNSAVTATSELGIDGRVEIDALNNDLTGSLVELPSNLIDAESLLQELCAVKVENFSSFISEGRGGLPPLPGEPLPSLMIQP